MLEAIQTWIYGRPLTTLNGGFDSNKSTIFVEHFLKPKFTREFKSEFIFIWKIGQNQT